MSITTLISDIETYGANQAGWPDSVKASYAVHGSHPEVQQAMLDVAELDSMLEQWEEMEDAPQVDDEPDFDEESDEPEEEGVEVSAEEEPEEERELPFGLEVLDEARDVSINLEAALLAVATKELRGEEYLVFTRDLDAIEYVVPHSAASTETLEEAVGSHTRVMAKEMQRLIAARSLTVNQNGLRKGKINASSLHRLSVNDDRVFRKRVEGQSLDVAVTLLIDQSGSMYYQKNQTAIASAYAFADVLDRLKVKNEVIGFTTHSDTSYRRGSGKFPHLHDRGLESHAQASHAFARSMGRSPNQVRWEPLLLPLVKSFNDRFDVVARKRLATMYDTSWCERLVQNVDGECLRIAAQRLRSVPAKRHILMVFSDGAPASLMDRTILATDLHHAVEEISASGVDLIGIGIQDHNAAAYYPKSVIVNSMADLSTVVMTELKKVLIK